MARSSRRFGRKMPGVSTRMICALFSITMPRISARVVCTLRETIVTLEPTSALTSVDLPTLGAPISATKPQRVAAGGVASAQGSSVIAAAADAFARDHHGGRDLFGRALAAADAFGRRQPRQIHRDAELRIVMRPGAFDLAIDRRRQALALRPFLQHGLGIAQRPPRLAHPLGPVALDELRRGAHSRRRETPRRSPPRRCRRARICASARPAPAPTAPSLMSSSSPSDLATSAQLSLRTRSASRFDNSPSSAFGKGAVQHVGDDQSEHVIAEEFQPLIAVAALALQASARRHA